MSLPTIQPRTFFGLTTGIKGAAAYTTEGEVLYPTGALLIAHNYNQKRQRHIKLPEKQRPINCICVSPSRKVVAVAEKGEKPVITIYDIGTLKKKKVLGQQLETTAEEFVSLAFSFEGKYLAVIVGEPDWNMFYFQWEKGKIHSSTKANNPTGLNPGTVSMVACNPNDSSVMVVVGPQLFRLLASSEKIWRQYGWSKPEFLNFTCVTWLSFDRVAAGTNDGHLLIIDGGDLKAVFKALNISTINMKQQEESLTVSSTSLVPVAEPEPEMAVNSIIYFKRGFAYACGSGMVHFFEKETNHKYIKRNLYIIPEPEFKDPHGVNINVVQNLSISIEEDRLLATTLQSQLYFVKLWGPDISQAPEVPFKTVGEPLHHGPVVGLAVCAWKPLFMTCGQIDHTVRVWNYETETQELVRQYHDEIFSVAIHPTGQYTVIGFMDKLRFMILLIDDIQPLREFPIRSCRECTFSTSGHLFAAANGNVIQVYSSMSFENIYNLKGHNGKVRSLMWANRDLQLISCGTEGAIYIWDVPTGTRISEVFVKDCVFNCVATTQNGHSTFGVGSNGCVTEVVESAITNSINVMGQPLGSVVLSRSDLMMFLAADNGSVLSVKYPLQEPLTFTEFHTHNQPITRMNMTYNDLHMITCSVDGSVCIWKLTFTEGKTVKMDPDFKHSTEVLISKRDLLEKVDLIRDLTLRMQELQTEHAYKMQKTGLLHDQKIKDIHESYYQALEELREKNEQLESDHQTEMNAINNDIAKTKSTHEETIISMESNFNEKLIVEYDKYLALEGKTNRMRDDYEKRLEELENKRQADLSDTTDSYETLLTERQKQIKELKDQAQQQKKEHEIIKQQIEDDADREIVDMKTDYEKELFEERDVNLRLRGETGVIKKKYLSSQKEIEEFKHQVYTLQQEQQKFQQAIVGLERDIQDLKKEIVERDTTIQDKEKRISELKRKNQELDKFKFVLNYKIAELKSQIEPKDKEIKEKKDQIQDMEFELENLQRINTSLELQGAELRDKLNATTNEMNVEHEKNRASNALLRRIRFDLHNASGLIQDNKKLRDTVVRLYHKYSQDSDFMGSHGQDIDAQQEFMRQREHLERTVYSLKKQVYKDMGGKRDDIGKIIQENSMLIVELNNLRKDLKDARKHISEMESVLGFTKFSNPREAKARLQMAVTTHEDIHKEYQNKIMEMEKMIQALKEEIQRLVQKLNKEEQEEYLKRGTQVMHQV